MLQSATKSTQIHEYTQLAKTNSETKQEQGGEQEKISTTSMYHSFNKTLKSTMWRWSTPYFEPKKNNELEFLEKNGPQ
jgi:hypothetical protein